MLQIILSLFSGIHSIEYSQCGGTGYTGSTSCAQGLNCYAQDQWYSQCLASCPSNWACNDNQLGTTTSSPSVTTGAQSSADNVLLIDFGGKIP